MTKPRGRVVVAAYGPPAQIDFLTLFMGAMQTAVPGFSGLPSEPPPLEFQLANAEMLRWRLREATLVGVEVETVIESLQFESGTQLWDWVTNSNPIGARLVVGFEHRTGRRVREALDEMIGERMGENEVVTPTNPVHIGVGTAN